MATGSLLRIAQQTSDCGSGLTEACAHFTLIKQGFEAFQLYERTSLKDSQNEMVWANEAWLAHLKIAKLEMLMLQRQKTILKAAVRIIEHLIHAYFWKICDG